LCTTLALLPATARESAAARAGDWQSELPSHVTDPDAIGSISVGHPHQGFLFNGVPMPEGKQWMVAVPKFAWGTDETIANLMHCIGKVNEMHPDAPRVVIGSISLEHGGPFKPHQKNLDLPRTWALLRAFVTETDLDMILVDESIKALLEEHALAIGEDAVWVADLFRGNGSRFSQLVKHVPGHTAHMHVRFSSPVARERGRRAYPGLVEQGHLRLASKKVPYRVQRGDTLIGIASEHDTTVEAIVRQNGLTSRVIRVGQKLEIDQVQHLRGAGDRVIVPRRRLPRPDAERQTVTSATAPRAAPADN
jgi:penicillin-insensitive murein endopeptidase